MAVMWVAISDRPGPESVRSIVERNSIALLSNHRHPVDPPSEQWLGRDSDRAEIRQSGLWNVDYVDDEYDPAFLGLFEELAAAACVTRRRQ